MNSEPDQSVPADASNIEAQPALPMVDDPAMLLAPAEPEPAQPPRQRPLADWFREAARVATFRAPDWRGLPDATPALLMFIVALELAVAAAFSWLEINGPAQFYPEAINAGWLRVVAVIVACWGVTRSPAQPDDVVADKARPGVAALVAMALLCDLFITIITSGINLPLVRLDLFAAVGWGMLLRWAVWGFAVLWGLAAVILMLMRVTRSASGSALAVFSLIVVLLVHFWARPSEFWYPDYSAGRDDKETSSRYNTSHLRPERLFKQATMLDGVLAALPEQRPGQIDVYVITYSPYAGEDVFLNESREVSRVMAERFGAAAHIVQMVNNRATVDSLPWATPDNLRKALAHVGKLIDPAEDMVFIHFASHGGSDGRLASEFWPLEIDRLQAVEVREALDAAHIPVRVISVSACYSGTWIAPLTTDGTLIMTASDDKHTSYGCGRKSELTFFTRAVFSEQLGSKTRDFEQALAAARPIIEAREKEAGKDDGFSNPQIYVGPLARERVARWRDQSDSR